MLPLCPNTIAWSLTALQALGVGTAWLARVSEGTNRQAVLQVLFLVLLIVVALGIVPALTIGRGQCVTTGAALSLMVLTAVWDFTPNRQMSL